MATTTLLYQHEWSAAGIHSMKDYELWIHATTLFTHSPISCIVSGHCTRSLLFSGGGSPGSGT